MKPAPIYFRFSDRRSALLAMDTLQEVGFDTEILPQQHPDHHSILEVDVVKADLTSALEIAEAHGGALCESGTYGREHDVYVSAYDLDQAPVVSASSTGRDPEEHLFDPSEQEYDHFSAGVHL